MTDPVLDRRHVDGFAFDSVTTAWPGGAQSNYGLLNDGPGDGTERERHKFVNRTHFSLREYIAVGGEGPQEALVGPTEGWAWVVALVAIMPAALLAATPPTPASSKLTEVWFLRSYKTQNRERFTIISQSWTPSSQKQCSLTSKMGFWPFTTT